MDRSRGGPVSQPAASQHYWKWLLLTVRSASWNKRGPNEIWLCVYDK